MTLSKSPRTPSCGNDTTYFVELFGALSKYSVQHRAQHKLKIIHIFFHKAKDRGGEGIVRRTQEGWL